MDTLNGRRWLLLTVIVILVLVAAASTVSAAPAMDGFDGAGDAAPQGLLPAWAERLGRRDPVARTGDSAVSTADDAGHRGAVLSPASPQVPGFPIEVFTNTWSYSSLGLVYDPSSSHVKYVH